MLHRTKWSSFLVLMVAGSLVLTACGASTPETVEVEVETVVTQVVKETEVVVVTSTPEPVPMAEPKYGGTFMSQASDFPKTLDPHMMLAWDARVILMNCYSALVRVDPDGEIVGDLATSWDISDDGLEYTFPLREDARFHNVEPVNGRGVTAQDVVYSIERLGSDDPQVEQFAAEYSRIAGAEALDDHTVKITLDSPWAGFLYKLGGEYPISIVPKEAVEEWGDLSQNLVGSGPFQLEWFQPDIGARMNKNPDYYVEGLPYLDAIEIRIIPEVAAKDAVFLAKDIHHRETIEAPTREQWASMYPDMYFLQRPDSWGPPSIVLNGNRPPFNDPRVRKALSLAIDRQKVLDTYGFGEGTLAGPIPTYAKMWALPQEELAQIPGYGADREADLAEAKRLLAEAGYPDGEGLDIKILGSTHPAAAKLATIIQNRLKEDLGLDLEVESLEWGAFLGQVIGSNFDIGVLVTDVVLDPDDILVRFYHPDVLGSVWGVTRETEPELVDLVEAQSVETDVAKRQELVQEAQRMILDKAYWIYLVDRTLFDAYWQDVQGASVYPLRADYDLMNVWLDR